MKTKYRNLAILNYFFLMSTKPPESLIFKVFNFNFAFWQNYANKKNASKYQMCDVWCSFTGGCDTGISISKKAGMIPLQMELGGKDSCIVLEDADLELAATNIIKGGFSYRFLFTL
jgi:hypothetical protein